MAVCHLLLERPWKYDINVVHDGRKNTYALEKNGRIHMLLSIEDKKVKEEASNTILLMSGKEHLREVKKDQEMHLVVLRNPRVILTSTLVDDLLEEIQELLEKFVDIVVEDLPCSLLPIISISHHIDLIPGEILPNKAVYRLTSQENEEVKKQV
jgi:hypothetical protein